MLKRRIISLLTVLTMIAAIAPSAVSAARYEYTWSFAKQGYDVTEVDGELAYQTTGNANFYVDLSVDDEGNKIPAEDIKYLQVSYYISVPEGVTSGASGRGFQTQATTANTYTGYDSSGTGTRLGGGGGFFPIGSTTLINTWAYNTTTEMTNIIKDVEEHKKTYSEVYVTHYQLRPFYGATLADGEKVYLKDIKIYTANPATETAGTEHTVTFYADDTKTEVVSNATYTSNVSPWADTITLPAAPSGRDGFIFVGWKKANTNAVLSAGSSYAFVDGADIEFCGVWNTSEVYVSESGDDAAFGTQTAPVATLARAMELVDTDVDSTVWIDGTVEYKDVPAHSGKLVISTKTSGTLTAADGIKLSGETKFSGITVSGALSTYANKLEMQNVTSTEVSLGGDMTVGGNGVAPQDEYAVLDGGTYTNIYLGGEDTSYAYGTYTGRNTLYIDNAEAGTVYLGHSTSRDQLFAGDVSLIVNNSTVDSFTDSGRAIGWVAGAVQLLANYGSEVSSAGISTTSISYGKWFMYSDANGGLDVTDTEGVFTVNDGKTAVAVNRSTSKTYYSANGTLKVPEGTYDVSYLVSPVYTYSDDMQTLTVNSSFTADFEIIEHKDIDGKLFLGWRYADNSAPANGSTLAASTVLYAHYTDFDTSVGGDFYVEEEAEIRQTSEEEAAALRFIVHRSNNIDIPGAQYGTVVLPKIIVQNSDLVIDGRYEYPFNSGNYYTAEKIPALNNYVEEDDYTKYTLCVTDIPEEEYIRDLTVRGYAVFTDDNGILREAYTDKADNNMYETAEKAERTDLTDAARKAYDAYGETAVGYRESEQTSRGETAHQTNYSGILFMETTIDTGLNLETPLEFISFGDQHFKYMDGLDLENPEIMYAAKKRKDSTNPLRRHYQAAQNVMEYASMFDYTMFTGDTIDFFSYGSLDVAKDVMFSKSPESLVALGYHDYVVYTINGRSNKEFDQSAAKNVLRQYYPNDITYASYDVPNTPIKVVYVDDSRNGQFYYSDGIQDKLAADIESARENNQRIFIIKHEGMCTNNEEQDLSYGFIAEEDENSIGYSNYGKVMDYKICGGDVWFNMKPEQASYDQVKGTKAVYELIYTNADVIRGVFHGHVHANYVTEINATYKDANGNTVATTIPQYSSMLNGSFDYGMGLKINIK